MYGQLQGRGIFGISTLSFIANRLNTTVEECSKAAGSADSRDKLFVSLVEEFNPYASAALRDELPAFEAAKASLAAAAVELSEVLPTIDSCRKNEFGAPSLSRPVHLHLPQTERGEASLKSRLGRRAAANFRQTFDIPTPEGASARIVNAVDDHIGVDVDSLRSLMQGARAVILQLRTYLK